MHLVLLASAGSQLGVRPMSAPAGDRVLTLAVTELITLSVIEQRESLAL